MPKKHINYQDEFYDYNRKVLRALYDEIQEKQQGKFDRMFGSPETCPDDSVVHAYVLLRKTIDRDILEKVADQDPVDLFLLM